MPAGSSVTYTVTCTVAAGATGTLANTVNVTPSLSSPVSATDNDTDLGIAAVPPGFTKSFAPDPIASGGTSTLTFTIDNAMSPFTLTSIDFTDTLPAGVTVATPSNAATTCTGGVLTAVAGSGTISYGGGGLAANSVCTVQADVTSSTVGAHVNTSGDLTSSSGNSGTATDTLTVLAAPTFTKVFTPDSIAATSTTTLTSTITNTNTVSVAGLDFTDTLPAAVTVASNCITVPTATGTGTEQICMTGGGPGCLFTALSASTADSLGTPPAGVAFPHGLVSFTASGCNDGATVEFTATFSITDGGTGDSDGVANGTIDDPNGPAAAAVPTLPQWALILLALLLASYAVVTLRRRADGSTEV